MLVTSVPLPSLNFQKAKSLFFDFSFTVKGFPKLILKAAPSGALYFPEVGKITGSLLFFSLGTLYLAEAETRFPSISSVMCFEATLCLLFRWFPITAISLLLLSKSLMRAVIASTAQSFPLSFLFSSFFSGKDTVHSIICFNEGRVQCGARRYLQARLGCLSMNFNVWSVCYYPYAADCCGISL